MKPKRGQFPRKRADGAAEEVMYIRLLAPIRAGVDAFRVREGLATNAEAVRGLLKKALEAEGLL